MSGFWNTEAFRGRRRKAGVVGIVAIMLATGAIPAQAISIRDDTPVSQYNALAEAQPAAGFLSKRGVASCSATLVAPDKVLTAAHCVDYFGDGNLDVSAEHLMFGTDLNIPSGFSNNVGGIAVHPLWNTDRDPAFDLAVLTLSQPVTDVVPARIVSQNQDPLGLVGTMVGYGLQGTGVNHPSFLPDANDKLAAQNMIDWVDSTVRTDFDSPTNNRSTYGGLSPLALEGTTASGDSGGPIFAPFGDINLVVGVLSQGWNDLGYDSEYGDISEWTYVGSDDNLAFLADHGITPFAPLHADFDEDGNVDGDDFLIWQRSFGIDAGGDADDDGDTDGNDFLIWHTEFTSPAGEGSLAVAVPEPAAAPLMVCCALLAWRRRRSSTAL